MKLYCEDKNIESGNDWIFNWFNAGEDLDDFIFYDVKEKISER